jgi:hypothetical protein
MIATILTVAGAAAAMSRDKMIEKLAEALSRDMDQPISWNTVAAAVLDLCGPEPLDWDYVSNTHTWQAQSPYGEYSVGFDDGWWGQLIGNIPWEWEPDCDPRTYDGPAAAQAAAQDHATAAHWANTPLGKMVQL